MAPLLETSAVGSWVSTAQSGGEKGEGPSVEKNPLLRIRELIERVSPAG